MNAAAPSFWLVCRADSLLVRGIFALPRFMRHAFVVESARVGHDCSTFVRVALARKLNSPGNVL